MKKTVKPETIARRAEELRAVNMEYMRLKDKTNERMAIWAARKAQEKATFNPCNL